MARIRKQVVDGHVDSILLAILEAGPNYGYAIVQELGRRSAGVLKMGEGTVYPVLHRLEDRGLIASTWRESAGGRNRKYYRLNPKGRRTLADHRQQWQQLVQVMRRSLAPQQGAQSST